MLVWLITSYILTVKKANTTIKLEGRTQAKTDTWEIGTEHYILIYASIINDNNNTAVFVVTMTTSIATTTTMTVITRDNVNNITKITAIIIIILISGNSISAGNSAIASSAISFLRWLYLRQTFCSILDKRTDTVCK